MSKTKTFQFTILAALLIPCLALFAACGDIADERADDTVALAVSEPPDPDVTIAEMDCWEACDYEYQECIMTGGSRALCRVLLRSCRQGCQRHSPSTAELAAGHESFAGDVGPVSGMPPGHDPECLAICYRDYLDCLHAGDSRTVCTRGHRACVNDCPIVPLP